MIASGRAFASPAGAFGDPVPLGEPHAAALYFGSPRQCALRRLRLCGHTARDRISTAFSPAVSALFLRPPRRGCASPGRSPSGRRGRPFGDRRPSGNGAPLRVCLRRPFGPLRQTLRCAGGRSASLESLRLPRALSPDGPLCFPSRESDVRSLNRRQESLERTPGSFRLTRLLRFRLRLTIPHAESARLPTGETACFA